MKKRVVAIILIIMQLSSNLFAVLAQGDLLIASAPTVYMSKVVANASNAIMVVNKNFSQQMKLITDLADFSSKITNKAIPNNKKSKPQHRQSNTCLLPSNPVNDLRQIEMLRFANANFIVDQVIPITVMIIVVALFLSIRRQRFRKCFYLLPRGGIDDAVMSVIMLFIDPHWLTANGDFSFSGCKL